MENPQAGHFAHNTSMTCSNSQFRYDGPTSAVQVQKQVSQTMPNGVYGLLGQLETNKGIYFSTIAGDYDSRQKKEGVLS